MAKKIRKVNVTVRFAPADKRAMEARAKVEGMRFSTWARLTLLNAAKK